MDVGQLDLLHVNLSGGDSIERELYDGARVPVRSSVSNICDASLKTMEMTEVFHLRAAVVGAWAAAVLAAAAV